MTTLTFSFKYYRLVHMFYKKGNSEVSQARDEEGGRLLVLKVNNPKKQKVGKRRRGENLAWL